MYEKLDRLRADVERCKKRIEDDRARLKAAEAKLQEAENTQILADVGALNLSPEQLAELLRLVNSGKVVRTASTTCEDKKEFIEEEEFDESEDAEDEEN